MENSLIKFALCQQKGSSETAQSQLLLEDMWIMIDHTLAMIIYYCSRLREKGFFDSWEDKGFDFEPSL